MAASIAWPFTGWSLPGTVQGQPNGGWQIASLALLVLALQYATRVGQAVHDCQSPWLSIIVRRCFGMAGGMHAPKYGEALNHRYAWPSARWGSIPIEGGVMAAHKAEIEAAPEPAAKRAELEAFYLDLTSPFRTAEKFGILDIIDPRETRAILCDWVADAWGLCAAGRAGRAGDSLSI